MRFTGDRGVDPLAPTPQQFIDFLAHFYATVGLAVGSVLNIKSGVLNFLSNRSEIVSCHQFKLFLQGLSKCPKATKDAFVWDVNKVIAFLTSVHLDLSSPYFVGRHLALLILLFGGRRVHDLTLLSIKPENMAFVGNSVSLQPVFGSKTDKLGKIQSPFLFQDGPVFQLSIPSLLRHYLNATKRVRESNTSLFVRSQLPKGPASVQLLRSWIKSLLRDSGITATAGSTRSASASDALLRGLSIEDIMARGNWSSAGVLTRHYLKEVQ